MTLARPTHARVSTGRLVVLILMVLVASIGTGLLVQSLGLMELATVAGGGGSEDVSRLIVVGQTGTAIQDGAVGRVDLVVRPGPDSGAVGLRDVAITWVGADGAYDLVGAGSSGDGDGRFSVEPLGEPDESPLVLDEGELAVLSVDLGDTDDVEGVSSVGSRLQPGDAVLLTLATSDGPSTYVRLDVPNSPSGRDAIAL